MVWQVKKKKGAKYNWLELDKPVQEGSINNYGGK